MFMSPEMRDRDLTVDAAQEISKSWWVLLLAGSVTAIAGIIVLGAEWTVEDLALFVGILLIFRGVAHMIGEPADGASRRWTIVVGLLEVGAGIAAMVWPGPSLLVVATFIGAWILVSGIVHVAGALANRHYVSYWWVGLALGIVEIVLGMWALARPGVTLVVAILAVGFWALIAGVLEIMLAFEVKHLPKLVALEH
jgi:uncharacterized membrane protein HdeD (DUF308 family)